MPYHSSLNLRLYTERPPKPNGCGINECKHNSALTMTLLRRYRSVLVFPPLARPCFTHARRGSTTGLGRTRIGFAMDALKQLCKGRDLFLKRPENAARKCSSDGRRSYERDEACLKSPHTGHDVLVIVPHNARLPVRWSRGRAASRARSHTTARSNSDCLYVLSNEA